MNETLGFFGEQGVHLHHNRNQPLIEPYPLGLEGWRGRDGEVILSELQLRLTEQFTKLLEGGEMTAEEVRDLMIQTSQAMGVQDGQRGDWGKITTRQAEIAFIKALYQQFK